MAGKMRRHSVAVMSTSYLAQLTSSDQHNRFSTGNTTRIVDDQLAVKKQTTLKATGSKVAAIPTEKTKAPLSNSLTPPSTATSVTRPSVAAAPAKGRRHSVAVHPGALVSVMETSGGKQVQSQSISAPFQAPTSSKFIDDLIDAADKALLRSMPLPSGSDIMRMALEEVDEEDS